MRARRVFRGAEFEVEIVRMGGLASQRVEVDGAPLLGSRISGIEPGRRYSVRVELPA